MAENRTRTSSSNPSLRGPFRSVISIDFSADGTLMASAGDDGWVIVWEIASCNLLREYNHEGTNTWSSFWSRWTLQPTFSMRAHSAHIHSVAFSPDDRQLASGSWDHTAKLWSLESHSGKRGVDGIDQPLPHRSREAAAGETNP
ncbi:WD40 repeat domain-containing protein [Stieleria maiorica]|uniref:WD40 repeat domain-containing protein n=1 Tax=Stieleria maiorica TaxID=2795974 RepID=UPI0011C9F877